MRRLLIGCGGVFAVLIILTAITLITLPKTTGFTLDWKALIKLQPPIFITHYKVVDIERDCFENVSSLPLVGVDIWSVGDEYIRGRTVDAVIFKLKKEDCEVNVLFESMEEYQRAIDES